MLALALLASTAWFTSQVADARENRERAEAARTLIIELRDQLRKEHLDHWQRRAQGRESIRDGVVVLIRVTRGRVARLARDSTAPQVPALGQQADGLLANLESGVAKLQTYTIDTQEYDNQSDENERQIAALGRIADAWVAAESAQAENAADRQERLAGQIALGLLGGSTLLILIAVGAWFVLDRATRRALDEMAGATEDLEDLTRTDALTGLANRRAFEEALRVEKARAVRTGRPLSLVVFDIDRFKDVNDTHGHGCGDRVLREVARRLDGAARSHELVARVGGEEFGWILPDTDAEAAVAAAERARVAVAGAPVEDLAVTVSAGAAEYAGPADRIVERADRALYAAKRAGRDRVAPA
ncbi:MAG TPA: GGDEF domain-containing protein [Miltoncostaeaceae bacterium]|nr:GGDEF domain-containing protein [Miltoncostaeaceae bacterium]